ncbi:helix-turn-helix domain-containing protein [Acinetobacter pollinis]|uniref:helix-turn-helix domain-containing protein n=1 Tax=Acinetobacter pollinis TaxID=2605270 RepID=UPI0018A31CF5|nr:helix-turn-helix domain-containing protein [Acinetobacter pollinis]MBF7689608.1 helix-turn-helix domain-containing protein [Acinetobacter pollinis]MBF7698227.1 helix-turn-helix domain-containing protein [Acinetobacter pollinis]
MCKQLESWDRHQIKAAIERRCKSLTALAKIYDVPPQTIRNALDKPSKKGEQIISDFLNIPLHILFPTRWTNQNKRIYPRNLRNKDL